MSTTQRRLEGLLAEAGEAVAGSTAQGPAPIRMSNFDLRVTVRDHFIRAYAWSSGFPSVALVPTRFPDWIESVWFVHLCPKHTDQ